MGYGNNMSKRKNLIKQLIASQIKPSTDVDILAKRIAEKTEYSFNQVIEIIKEIMANG